MDIKQQTKNVAAQGRFGDSMLLHVNPAEVKGLAGAMPLTINPDTGQPEAFLPFLAPLLGGMLGPTVLGAVGLGSLSTAALTGIGAGLATYAQTGGSGSKALLSGLTSGLGSAAFNTAAQGVAPGVDAATSSVANAAMDPAVTSTFGQGASGGFGTLTGNSGQAANVASQSLTPAITNQSTLFESGKAIFGQPGGFDAGMKTLAGAAMTPTGILAGTTAGTAGIIASQEAFERQMIQMGLDEEERKKRMYERYPEMIPMASGGRTGFYTGGNSSSESSIYDIDDGFNSGYSVGGGGSNGGSGGGRGYDPYTNMNLGFNSNAYAPIARRTRPIPGGYMAGFGPEQRYFQGNNPAQYLTQYARDIAANNPDATPEDGASGSPQDPAAQPTNMQQDQRYSNFRPQMYQQPFNPYAQSYQPPQPMAPPGGFRNEGRYGYTPPQMFGGYGNPYMQRPSYQSFYGNPQMNGMINPYQAFSQMPIPRYIPPPPTPPVSDGGGDTGGGDTGGGGDAGGGTGDGNTPPINLPPINDPGIGRKGGGINVPPQAGTEPYEGSIFGNKTGTPPVNTPPPTITIPIEGGADVTIPDYSQPQPPARPGPPADFNPAAGIPGSGVPPVQNPGDFRDGLPSVTDFDNTFSPEQLDDMRNKFGPEPDPIAPPVIAPPMDIAPPMKGNDKFSASQSGLSSIDGSAIKEDMRGIDDKDYTDYSGYLDFYDKPPSMAPMDIAPPRDQDMLARLSPAQLASIGAPMSQSALDQNMRNSMDIAPPVFGPQDSIGIQGGDGTNPLQTPIAMPRNPGMVADINQRMFPPPVQSEPQPFLQQPQAPQTGGIPVTEQGDIFNAKPRDRILPAGPPPVTGPAPGERQIPTGPTMGGIGSFTPPPVTQGPPPVEQIPGRDNFMNDLMNKSPMQAPLPQIPTPAAPGNMSVDQQPKPPMSGGMFGAPMFAAGGDTDLPNKGLKALDKVAPEVVEAMGYQEGGQTDMMQDPITQGAIMFILGESEDENAINMFVEKYGSEQFLALRDTVLKQAAGNPEAQTEGLIQGNGNSGMADDLPGVIGNKEQIAVSQDEFIVPADVVSMLGDGSSDAGSKQLYNMMDRVRQAKTGGTTQASPINPSKVMPG